MTPVWNKIESLAGYFEQQLSAVADSVYSVDREYADWHNLIYASDRFRRAHVEVVDRRESHGIYILHTTIFPHVDDPSPIFGFDAVCGKNKITGAFHDYSISGDAESAMCKWFDQTVRGLEWNKPRALPEWAQQIFSPAMIAAGNLQEETEIEQLCELAKTTLDFYLSHVGADRQDGITCSVDQNRYCHWQKQNPHVIRSMVSMGVEEHKMRKFVEQILFPEIV